MVDVHGPSVCYGYDVFDAGRELLILHFYRPNVLLALPANRSACSTKWAGARQTPSTGRDGDRGYGKRQSQSWRAKERTEKVNRGRREGGWEEEEGWGVLKGGEGGGEAIR